MKKLDSGNAWKRAIAYMRDHYFRPELKEDVRDAYIDGYMQAVRDMEE